MDKELLERAARFYERIPDGQYDEIAAKCIRAVLRGDVPSGWKLVPLEPTANMLDAPDSDTVYAHDMAGIYKAMLKAAPNPPSNSALPSTND